MAGSVLLILAWGLSRRLSAAFHATRVILALGAVLMGLGGGWLAPAAVLVLVLVLLAPARREFFRPTALTREPLSPDRLLGVFVVLGATLWLGLFAYRDVALSGELWWEFTLRGDASRFPHAVVRHEGRIVAFGNLWLGADAREFSLDLMRYDPAASPDGVMQYLFARTLLWGKEMGYQRFSLGMAPLSGLEGGALAPLSARLGAALFRHGEHFYNFKGLRAYKEKFDPVWEPRYLASPGNLALPRVLAERGHPGVRVVRGVIGR